ncbi:MAG: hypothetical protein PVI86_08955 [Phycisphaerae bacterium]|jgi:pimeloyl-ACP methyl ester carboxylesterase
MPDSPGDAVVEQSARRGINYRDWLMAGATILGPVGGGIFAAILTIMRTDDTQTPDVTSSEMLPWVLLVCAVVLGVSVVVWLWVRQTLNGLRRDLAAREREIKQQDGALAQQATEATDLRRSVEELQRELEARDAIRMIRPAQYMEILHKLTETHGPGHLLLFNVELNTFGDDRTFNAIWGKLAQLKEIKSVRFALPRRKFKRWQTIVTGVRDDFFQNVENGEKFVACEYPDDENGEDDRLAFALYESTGASARHDWGALFLINRPFIARRPDGAHEYLHILEYRGENEVLGPCRTLWDQVFDAQWAESATNIQTFRDLRKSPPELTAFLNHHKCDRSRRAVMKRVVGTLRIVDDSGKDPPPQELPARARENGGNVGFKIRYRHNPPIDGPDELVKGQCLGLDTLKDGESKPCIIWASGFGEGKEPRLAKILSRRLSGHGIDPIELFFTKSGKIEETTCTRMEEDIRAIVNYAVDIPGVNRDHICVIGISLSGYLAARLARHDERIKSLVLVAPPFDVVEMLDNFRRHYLSDRRRIPTFDDFLKAKNNLRIADWDRNPDYCNYFDHVVTSCHLVDLAIKGAHAYGRDAFLDALGAITGTGRRIALIYGRNDPIVCAKTHIPALEACIQRGFIEESRIHRRPVSVTHYYPQRGTAKEYPFRIDESNTTAIISEMAEAIRHCLGLVTGLPNVAEKRDPASDDTPPLKYKAG